MKILSALVLAALAGASQAQVTCNQVGQFTFCSDGTSYTHIGNNTFGSDGSSAQRIGNSTFITPPPQSNPYLQQPARPAQPLAPPDLMRPLQPQRCFYNAYGQYVCQ